MRFDESMVISFAIVFSVLFIWILYRLKRQKRIRAEVTAFIKEKLPDYAILHSDGIGITIDREYVPDQNRIKAHYTEEVLAVEEGSHKVQCYFYYSRPGSRYGVYPSYYINVDLWFEKGKEYKLRTSASCRDKKSTYKINHIITLKTTPVLGLDVLFEEKIHT